MSPEQAAGRPTSAASDVYGVGVVLYEMLAGRPPFDGEVAVEVAVRHLQDAPPPLPDAVPAELTSIVDRALAKEPGERYADGAELASALARVRPGLPAAGPAAQWEPPTTVLPGEDRTTVLPGEDRTTVLPGGEATTVMPGEAETTVLPAATGPP